MMLYHFLNEQYGLEALQNRELKVGRLLDLNDPADCRPILDGAPSRGSQEADAAFAQEFLQDLYNDFGAVSFSTTVKDPVIWSHYADRHRGLALGFDDGDNSNWPHNNMFWDVRYREDRPKINYRDAEDLRSKMKVQSDAKYDFIEKVIRTGFLQKAKSWVYESEYRRFVYLGLATMRGANFFETFFGSPAEVVLGVRCRLSRSDVIRAATRQDGLGGPRVLRTRLDPIVYSLGVEEIQP